MYEVERDMDRPTTVAATSLMSMTWATLGKDKAGHGLQRESASMAKRLGLYSGDAGDLSARGSLPTLDLGDEKVRRAAAATAWGSFNFQMQATGGNPTSLTTYCSTDLTPRVMSMSYRRAPLPRGPPRLPIPAAEIRVSAGRPTTPSAKSTYELVCRFWIVVFEMNYCYYSREVASLPFAEALFRKLLLWADGLEDAGAQRDEHSPDHVLNLQ